MANIKCNCAINGSLTFNAYAILSNSIPKWANFVKEVSKFSLESNTITALWLNGSITFTFHVTASNGIPYWKTFEKNFLILSLVRNWQNNCCVTQWQLNFHFLCHIFKKHTTPSNFCKIGFWYNVRFKKWQNDCFVTKWLFNFNFLYHIFK